MRIEVLWQELEREAQSGGAGVWLTRYALPEPSTPLLVALDSTNNRRALLLPLSTSVVPPKRDWPQCNGLEIFSISLAGAMHLGVRLLDGRSADVFSALAEDVAPRIASAPDQSAAASALLARLRRWQIFLAVGASGLSVQKQRGLFGELHAVRYVLMPSLGAARTISAWRSPLASHQDFQFSAVAMEVKATTAKQPTSVRISSERQLDTTGVQTLFLYVLTLDERETEPGPDAAGQSLPDMVQAIRRELPPEQVELFEDRLLEYGYLEADASRYETRRFAKREECAFLVSDRFPRVTEATLPVGVGDVSYALSLAACEPFAVSVEEMLSTMQRRVE